MNLRAEKREREREREGKGFWEASFPKAQRMAGNAPLRSVRARRLPQNQLSLFSLAHCVGARDSFSGLRRFLSLLLFFLSLSSFFTKLLRRKKKSLSLLSLSSKMKKRKKSETEYLYTSPYSLNIKHFVCLR